MGHEIGGGGICPWITGHKHEDSETPPLLLYSHSLGSKAMYKISGG